MLDVLTAMKAEARLEAALEQAWRTHPEYDGIYEAAAVDLMALAPKTNDTLVERINRIGRIATKATGRTARKAMYARVWLRAEDAHFSWWPFLDRKVDWAEMKAGMADVLKA